MQLAKSYNNLERLTYVWDTSQEQSEKSFATVSPSTEKSVIETVLTNHTLVDVKR